MSTTTDSTPRTYHTLATWRRLGAEDAADDRVRGHVDALDRGELESALAGHHATDLDACADDEARTEAIGALVQGYLHG